MHATCHVRSYVWTLPAESMFAVEGRKGSVSGDRQSFLNVHQDGVTGLRFTDESSRAFSVRFLMNI